MRYQEVILKSKRIFDSIEKARLKNLSICAKNSTHFNGRVSRVTGVLVDGKVREGNPEEPEEERNEEPSRAMVDIAPLDHVREALWKQQYCFKMKNQDILL